MQLFVKSLAGVTLSITVPDTATRLEFALAVREAYVAAALRGEVRPLGEDDFVTLVARGEVFGGVGKEWFDRLDWACRTEEAPFVDDGPDALSPDWVRELTRLATVHLVVRRRSADAQLGTAAAAALFRASLARVASAEADVASAEERLRQAEEALAEARGAAAEAGARDAAAAEGPGGA